MGLEGWSIEFYLDFFEIIGRDLLVVVEESRLTSYILLAINSTFIALIPNMDMSLYFYEYMPTLLSNYLYKIISIIIARCLKVVLSRNISLEQFGFLEG